jgi:hypothetical protein
MDELVKTIGCNVVRWCRYAWLTQAGFARDAGLGKASLSERNAGCGYVIRSAALIRGVAQGVSSYRGLGSGLFRLPLRP